MKGIHADGDSYRSVSAETRFTLAHNQNILSLFSPFAFTLNSFLKYLPDVHIKGIWFFLSILQCLNYSPIFTEFVICFLTKKLPVDISL